MERKSESEQMPYEDWRRDLAHVSARRVNEDQRDLIPLARRVEKSLGRYLTRAKRRRRLQSQVGEPDETSSGIGR